MSEEKKVPVKRIAIDYRDRNSHCNFVCNRNILPYCELLLAREEFFLEKPIPMDEELSKVIESEKLFNENWKRRREENRDVWASDKGIITFCIYPEKESLNLFNIMRIVDCFDEYVDYKEYKLKKMEEEKKEEERKKKEGNDKKEIKANECNNNEKKDPNEKNLPIITDKNVCIIIKRVSDYLGLQDLHDHCTKFLFEYMKSNLKSFDSTNKNN